MQDIQEYIAPSDASVKSDLSLKDFGAIVYRRRRVIISLLIVALIVALLLAAIPHRHYCEAQVTLVQRAQSASVNAQESYAAPWVESVATPFDMLQTAEAYDRGIQYLKNIYIERGEDPHKIAQKYDQVQWPKHVKVYNTKGSNTIDITTWAYSQQDARDLANAAAQSFVEWKTEQAQRDVTEIIDNFRRKVASTRDQLTMAENRELLYKQLNHITDVTTEQKNALDLLANRQSGLLDAQQGAASEHAKLATLQQQLGTLDQAIASGTGVRDDATVQSMQKELIEAETERNNLALHYTAAYPNKLSDVDQRIKDYKAQLAAAVKGTLDMKRPSLQDQNTILDAYRQQQVDTMFADAKLVAAHNGYAAVKTQTAAYPSIYLGWARLDRDVQIKTEQFNALVAALNQAIVDRNSITGDVEMTAPVSPDEFSWVQYIIYFLVGGIVIGLLVTVCTVLVLEQSDTKLYTVEETRRLLSGPVIGALPELRSRERAALASGIVPNSVASAFNIMRNNLQLVMRHHLNTELWDHQVILVASAGPNEGKTMAASQLARSIADSGRSVLLVDANLANEKERMSVIPRNPVGLAQVLNDGLDLHEAVVPSKTENLSLLPSGVADGHTTDLLSKPTLAVTIKKLRDMAEVVIIDAPACSLATDALYLAPYSDCMLQVIGLGSMDETVLADTIAALHAASPRAVAYLMLNTPRPKRRAGKFHYYALELSGYGGRNGSSFLNGAGSEPVLPGSRLPLAAPSASPVIDVKAGNPAASNDQE